MLEKEIQKNPITLLKVKSLLEDSNLKLNRELAKKEKWGIKEILSRKKQRAC